MHQREGVIGGQAQPGAQVTDDRIVAQIEECAQQRRQPDVAGEKPDQAAARRRGCGCCTQAGAEQPGGEEERDAQLGGFKTPQEAPQQ